MSRVRISTTVDEQLLERCRTLAGVRDSTILDMALEALVETLEGIRERDALGAQPYEDDPDLRWQAPSGPDLPYDGEVPEEVRRLAARRRKAEKR